MKVPPKGSPYRLRSRRTTGSSILDHDLGHLCRGKRIHTSGHLDFGTSDTKFVNIIHFDFGKSKYCVRSLSISQSGKLEMISMTFVFQHFSNDICPSMVQNELLRPMSLLHRSPLFCFWLLCCNESTPSPAIWSSWWFGNHSLIRNLVDYELQNTRKSCLNFIRCITPTTLRHDFAMHSRSNWCFQFLTSILDGFIIDSLSSGSMK